MEQKQDLQWTYYFERNGEIFGTSAIDAWNLVERINGGGNPQDRDIKFIGRSNGAIYKAAMAEAQKQVAPKKAEIGRLQGVLAAISSEEVSAVGDMAKTEELKKKREFVQEQIQSMWNEVNEKLEEWGKRAEEYEVASARNNKGKIPDFSVQGDGLGLKIFQQTNLQ